MPADINGTVYRIIRSSLNNYRVYRPDPNPRASIPYEIFREYTVTVRGYRHCVRVPSLCVCTRTVSVVEIPYFPMVLKGAVTLRVLRAPFFDIVVTDLPATPDSMRAEQ